MINTKSGSPSGGQVTIMSFFRFSPSYYRWGMQQMFFTQNRLRGATGLVFHKMLGTGGGSGYSFKPDFETFALLTVWEDCEKAEAFESKSEVMRRFRNKAAEIYSIFLSPVQARGLWSKQQPFIPGHIDPNIKLIAVLTRATLKASYYYHFWKKVKGVSRSHIDMPGLIFSKGVGERPWTMQATFSIWRSVEDMSAFAHNKNGKHYQAIKTTRKMKGFKEELYARFQPIYTKGSWHGKDPIGEALILESALPENILQEMVVIPEKI